MADQTLDDFLGVKPQPRWRKWVQWGVVIVGVVLLALLLKSCFGGSKEAGYATAPVTRGNLTVTVSATGKLAPTNQVTVGSQLSGLVTKVVVDVNDRVKAGEALALIDPEQIDDQIRAAQATLAANVAQVAQARATVSESQAQLARLEQVYKLSNGRVPSATELQAGRADAQRAVAALRVAEANVTAARAQLAQSQTQRQRAIIRSPVSGVVLARQVDPGQTVAASFNTPTLFVIAEDLTKMKLEVAIDEADVGEVKVGQKADFTVDAFPGGLSGDDHPCRSGIEPDGERGDLVRLLDQQRRVDHGAGGQLCRRSDGGESRPATAPRHDRDRRYRDVGQEKRPADPQRRAALQAVGRRASGRRWHRGIADLPSAPRPGRAHRDRSARRDADRLCPWAGRQAAADPDRHRRHQRIDDRSAVGRPEARYAGHHRPAVGRRDFGSA